MVPKAQGRIWEPVPARSGPRVCHGHWEAWRARVGADLPGPVPNPHHRDRKRPRVRADGSVGGDAPLRRGSPVPSHLNQPPRRPQNQGGGGNGALQVLPAPRPARRKRRKRRSGRNRWGRGLGRRPGAVVLVGGHFGGLANFGHGGPNAGGERWGERRGDRLLQSARASFPAGAFRRFSGRQPDIRRGDKSAHPPGQLLHDHPEPLLELDRRLLPGQKLHVRKAGDGAGGLGHSLHRASLILARGRLRLRMSWAERR